MVFRQLLFMGLVLDLPELGHPIDNHAHHDQIRALNHLKSHPYLPRHHAKKATGDRHSIQFQLGRIPAT